MAFLVGVLEGDFDAWKQRFDSDPLGRKQVAKGHTILRATDKPDRFFVRIEFDSVEDAKAFADKVRGSEMLAGLNPIVPPTAAELVDQASY